VYYWQSLTNITFTGTSTSNTTTVANAARIVNQKRNSHSNRQFKKLLAQSFRQVQQHHGVISTIFAHP
jgi:hypothetical protein